MHFVKTFMARLDLELHGFSCSAVFGGEVAGRRWLAGGWSRLPAVRRAGRSLLVAREEDRGASPLLPTTLATRTRKTKQLTQGYFKIHPRSQSHRLGAGLGKQEARSPPGAAFVAVELSAVGQLVHRHNTAGATRGCGQPSQQADK